jgi:hypothetical protein
LSILHVSHLPDSPTLAHFCWPEEAHGSPSLSTEKDVISSVTKGVDGEAILSPELSIFSL